ncbi:MAG: MarR family transcriptional regulator [Lawsonibacter sp.]|nr:MarR family transcriptional regulator [Lawsonibacter sp.]
MAELTFQQFNLESCRMYKEDDGLYRRLARHFGLSDSAFWILYALQAANRPLTQAEMSSYLNLSKQTINSGMKSLEQAGHIRLSGGGGRRKYLELTPQGQALSKRTVQLVLEMEERAYRLMPEEEQAALLDLTRRHLELRLQEARQIFDMSQED